MNTNAIHNILNLVGLILGSLIVYDWTQLGLTADKAAFVAGAILLADKVVKLGLNVTRDGVGGLFKPQPPVVK